MKEQHQILIGKKFGNLTILDIFPYYRKHNPAQRDYKSKVHCDLCKKDGIVNLRSIIGNKAKSCGCINKLFPKRGLNNKRCDDLRGKKFGMLTPIEIDNNRVDRVHWKCKCNCGKSKTVSSKNLMLGLTTSCGCKAYRTGKLNPSWKGYEEISGNQWNCIVRGAKVRNIEFSISIDYIWKLFIKQNRQCALTGQQLIFRSRSGISDGTASLDRIDSSKGYVEGNVQWVHKDVNTVKWDLTLDNFFKVCKMVVEYNKL
jgi:hypothetical protein